MIHNLVPGRCSLAVLFASSIFLISTQLAVVQVCPGQDHAETPIPLKLSYVRTLGGHPSLLGGYPAQGFDERPFISIDRWGKLRFFDQSTKKRLFELQGAGGQEYYPAIMMTSPDGKWFFLEDSSGSGLWSISERKLVWSSRVAKAHTDSSMAPAFLSDRFFCIVYKLQKEAAQKQYVLIDLQEIGTINTGQVPDEPVTSLQVVNDGRNLSWVSGDTLRTLNSTSGQTKTLCIFKDICIGRHVSIEHSIQVIAFHNYVPKDTPGIDWEIRTLNGALLSTFHTQQVGRTELIDRVRFSPDGQFLALPLTANGSILVVKCSNGKAAATLVPEADILGFDGLTWSPDGKLLVTSDSEGMIRLWNTETWKLDYSWQGGGMALNNVSIDSKSQQISIASWDGVMRAFTLEGKEIGEVPRFHTREVTCLEFTPDCKKIVSVSLDLTTKIWDSESGRVISSHGDPHTVSTDRYIRKSDVPQDPARVHQPVSSMAISPEGKVAIFSTVDGTLYTMEIETGQTKSLKHLDNGVYAMRAHGNGATVVTSECSILFPWTDQEQSQRLNLPHSLVNGALGISISENGDYALNWNHLEKKLCIFNLSKSELPLQSHPIGPDIIRMLITNDGRWVIVETREHLFYRVDISNGNIVNIPFDWVNSPVSCIRLNSTGTQFAVGFGDGHVCVVGTNSLKVSAAVRADEFGITALAFSKDGSHLAAGASNGAINIWQLIDIWGVK